MAHHFSPDKHKPDPSRNTGINHAINADLEEHIKALRRYARALTANPADADDLVQETLRRALTYLDRGKEIHNLRSYLLTMLHHARVDLAKRENRSGEHIPFDSCLFLATSPMQFDRLICNEALEAINRLAEEQRAVLLLIGLEELSYQEVADVLGVPIGTVMSRLSRGRKHLRKFLNLTDSSEDFVSAYLEGGGFIPEQPGKRPLVSDAD